MSRPAGRYMLFRAASGKRDSDVSWLVAGGIFLVALGVGYVVLSSEIGHPAAARRFFGRVLILLAVVFLALALFLTLPASAKGETWLALLLLLSAVCWAALLYRLQRKRQAGNRLLDLGRLPRQRLFILGGGLLALAGLLHIAQPRPDDYPVSGPVLGVFALSFAAYFLILGFYRLEVRERGILGFFGLVTWERIDSYRWEGKSGETLTVWVSRPRYPWFRDMSWRIPQAHKDRVQAILAQRLSGRTITPATKR